MPFFFIKCLQVQFLCLLLQPQQEVRRYRITALQYKYANPIKEIDYECS